MEEGPLQKIQCLDADWLPLSSQPVPKRKAKSRGLVDFTKEIYSADAGRLTGEAKNQVLNLMGCRDPCTANGCKACVIIEVEFFGTVINGLPNHYRFQATPKKSKTST